jgi:hypothetical protein
MEPWSADVRSRSTKLFLVKIEEAEAVAQVAAALVAAVVAQVAAVAATAVAVEVAAVAATVVAAAAVEIAVDVAAETAADAAADATKNPSSTANGGRDFFSAPVFYCLRLRLYPLNRVFFPHVLMGTQVQFFAPNVRLRGTMGTTCRVSGGYIFGRFCSAGRFLNEVSLVAYTTRARFRLTSTDLRKFFGANEKT